MEHHSLCSATGMPHSTQTRTRCVVAGVFDEKSRLRNDIQVSGSNSHASSLRNEPRPGYTRPVDAAIPWLDRRSRRRVGGEERIAKDTRRAVTAAAAEPIRARLENTMVSRREAAQADSVRAGGGRSQ